MKSLQSRQKNRSMSRPNRPCRHRTSRRPIPQNQRPMTKHRQNQIPRRPKTKRNPPACFGLVRGRPQDLALAVLALAQPSAEPDSKSSSNKTKASDATEARRGRKSCRFLHLQQARQTVRRQIAVRTGRHFRVSLTSRKKSITTLSYDRIETQLTESQLEGTYFEIKNPEYTPGSSAALQIGP